MLSSTVENYLKQLYLQQEQEPNRLVPMGKLASSMGVVPGTATSMIKALAESGLVHYEPRGGVKLSREGEQLALHVLRRHRLVELFLVRVLGLDWSEVHEEAEALEHSISDKVLQRIDAILNHPRTDPHGDPIPTADGNIHAEATMTLHTCPPNRPMRVAQVIDQQPEFLQFLNRVGLVPGAAVAVTGRDSAADSVSLKVESGSPIVLGGSSAAKVLVNYQTKSPSTEPSGKTGRRRQARRKNV
jgi:DtxR family transcriptional regulator, Mn-dependent transcriptional regulator